MRQLLKIARKGRCPTMRHISRTQRVVMDRLHETCTNERIQLRYINTHSQVADILTTHFTKVDTWHTLCRLLNIKPSTPPKRTTPVLVCLHKMPGPPLHLLPGPQAGGSSSSGAGREPVQASSGSGAGREPVQSHGVILQTQRSQRESTLLAPSEEETQLWLNSALCRALQYEYPLGVITPTLLLSYVFQPEMEREHVKDSNGHARKL